MLSLMTQPLKICSAVLWPGLKPACSSASLFFSLDLESIDDNSEHDLAGMADLADGIIAMALLGVSFLS